MTDVKNKIASIAKAIFGEDAPSPTDLGKIENDIIPEKGIAKDARYSTYDNDISGIEVLPEYEFVKAAIEEPGCPPLFVTGEAGTGKSTFIRWLRHEFGG